MIGKVIYSIYQATVFDSPKPNGCYPQVVPVSDDFPFFVYEVVDVNPSPTKDSPSSALDTVTVNITAIAKTQLHANTLADQFRDKLDKYTFPATINTVKVQSLRFQSQDEDYQDEIEAFANQLRYTFRITRT